MPVRKVSRGQPFNVSAHDWNTFADIANGGRIGQSSGHAQKNGDVYVTVKNGLGRDLMRYAAVCIGFPTAIHTGENDMIFPLYNSSLVGQLNSYATEPILGILQEPIANGRFGVAQIAGVTPAQFSHYDTPSQNAGPFAVMSDLDDKLAMSEFGPIQVLQYLQMNSGTGADNRYCMVKIATPVQLGAVLMHFTPTAWEASPDFNYTGMSFNIQHGDARHVGIVGDSESFDGQPVGRVYLGRKGRYVVTVNWAAEPSALTFVANDRLEWRVRWICQSSPSSTEAEYYSFSPHGWSQSVGLETPEMASGERSFYFNITTASVQQIPVPGIAFRKVAAAGGGSAATATGFGRIRVVRIGSSPHTLYWSDAERDTAWGRGETAGPIV